MRSLLLARRRTLTLCASALAAALIAGCTSTGASSSSVAGSTLTIYLSKPPGQLTATEQDVLSAEQLALRQIGSTVGKFTIKAVECPSTQCASTKLSDNARSAIADPTTIAYIGEVQPGTSGQTIGITNAQQVLQVSPTDTAVELTQSVPEVPGSPGKYYESLSANGRTFARVVPNDRLEAKALVDEMQSAGVKRLYVTTDGSEYGAALKGLVGNDAGAAGITIVGAPTGADAELYAGSSTAAGAHLFNQAAATNPSVKLFAPSALADDSFAHTLSAAAQRDADISSPGFGATDQPSQASRFVAAFKAAYRHTPATQAIFGYQAMASVLAALHAAGGSANNRGTVVKDFLAIKNHDVAWPGSAVGSYSIDAHGDISYAGGAPFVISRVKGGILVPFKAVQQPG